MHELLLQVSLQFFMGEGLKLVRLEVRADSVSVTLKLVMVTRERNKARVLEYTFHDLILLLFRVRSMSISHIPIMEGHLRLITSIVERVGGLV